MEIEGSQRLFWVFKVVSTLGGNPNMKFLARKFGRNSNHQTHLQTKPGKKKDPPKKDITKNSKTKFRLAGICGSLG